jgi:glycosyltransferase involved in cell wall biosynthesis
MNPPYLSIVLPAYNEEQRISSSLEQIRQWMQSKSFPVELILVDDGSSDRTPAILAEFQKATPDCQLLRNQPNRGKGFSVRRGVLEAQGKYALFTDADLSAPIEEADKLLAAIEQTGADAAIGSRALDRLLIGVHQPWTREFSGRCFNLLVRLFTSLNLRDTQCGFKLFRCQTTRRAFELQRVEGFGFDPEILFLIARRGGKIQEVPVRWNDNPATRVHFLRDSTRMFLDLVVLRWRAFTGKYPA